jgi:hypothetical protein
VTAVPDPLLLETVLLDGMWRVPDDAEHEMTARRLVAPSEFRARLFWGPETTAGLILERGLAIERGSEP